ncbi:hypothetical protein WJX79_000470 [Trebouxia sp. C0005]
MQLFPPCTPGPGLFQTKAAAVDNTKKGWPCVEEGTGLGLAVGLGVGLEGWRRRISRCWDINHLRGWVLWRCRGQQILQWGKPRRPVQPHLS